MGKKRRQRGNYEIGPLGRATIIHVGFEKQLMKLLSWVFAVLMFSSCAKVISVGRLPDITLGELAFFPTIEAHTDAPIVGGNRIEVLLNGDHTFPIMLRDIRAQSRPLRLSSIFLKAVLWRASLPKPLPSAAVPASKPIFCLTITAPAIHPPKSSLRCATPVVMWSFFVGSMPRR
jgi:hypothetical protein